jgi:hypothetical protein
MKTAAIFFISFFSYLMVPCVGEAQNAEARASFRFKDLSMRASLDSLMRWYPVSIIYLDSDIEGETVSASCTNCTFEEALNNVLEGTHLMWIRTGNQLILKQRPIKEPRPRATVSGVVTDSMTGEWIAGINVLLQQTTDDQQPLTRRWCPTNPYGFYSLRRVPPGEYTLVISALGYRTARIHVVTRGEQSTRYDVGLLQEDITFQEVTVTGQRTALTPAEGFTKGVYIRSTPSYQNQYLLDGARIYNPSHFGGVLSTFNEEVLNDVQVVPGGLPPYYGGRIGGVLDYSMRDGTRERLSGVAGTGSLGSHLALEGPLSDATTFLLSARRGYPDAPVPYLKNYGTPSTLGSTEIIGKVSHRLSSGYVGRDSYNNQVESMQSRLRNDFSWGNATLNLRWLGIASPSLFLHASAVYTRYDFTLKHLLSESLFPPSNTTLSSDYSIQDVSLRAHAEHYYDEQHTVRAGVELIRHQMSGAISAFSSRTAPVSMESSPSWELSVYLQDQWRLLPHVTAELGARATSFTAGGGSFSAVDPRFSLLVSPAGQTQLYASLTSINQFVHPYRNSGVFLLYPAIFWYPSNEKVKPSTSLQGTLGVQKWFGDNVYSMGAEFFYQVTNNLHEFAADTTITQMLDLNDAVLFGTGRTYGMEFSLRKRVGDLSGSISYTLSWARETFAELNNGESFVPWFDRRHELQISASYMPDQDWAIGALCVLASGQSPSFDPNILSVKERYESGVVFGGDVIDVNGSRLPGFERLELKVVRRFSFAGLPCQVSLRLMNAYGLLDPFVWELRQSADVRLKWRATLDDLKLFPLFPTVGVAVRF